MKTNDDREMITRFRYHFPPPNFYKVENPTKISYYISDDLLNDLELMAKSAGFLNVFYTSLDEEFYYKYPNDCRGVILFEIPMSKDLIALPPSKNKCKLIDDEFQEFGVIIYEFADFLRANGFKSEIIHPLDDEMNLRHLAVKSNEATILRSNICLFPEGPNMSLFGIVTSIKNLPQKKSNDLYWVKEYCKTCGKCIRRCPQDAYDSNENLKKKVCTAHSGGCNECMLNCPFFKKGYEHIKRIYFKKLNKV